MANYNSAAVAAKAFEDQDSPIENWSSEGLKATVKLRCLWTDRHEVMGDLLNNARGYPNVLGTGGVFLSFAATGVVAPVAQSSIAVATEQSLQYQQALLTVNYMPTESADDGGGGTNLFSETFEPNAEFLTLNPKGYSFDIQGRAELTKNDPIAKLMLSFDYMQTRYRLASIPSAVLTLAGRVNNAEVTASLLGLAFPAETLLFNPPTLSRQLDSEGNGLWTMNTRYSYRESTWNKVWRPGTATFEPIYDPGGNLFKNYPLGDFSDIQI